MSRYRLRAVFDKLRMTEDEILALPRDEALRIARDNLLLEEYERARRVIFGDQWRARVPAEE